MDSALVQRKAPVSPAQQRMSTAHATLLSSIGRIEKQDEARKVQTVENKTAARLMEAFGELKHNASSPEVMYEESLKLISGIQYSASDVSELCIRFLDLQDEEYFGRHAGFFLSALINTGKDEKYVLPTAGILKPLEYLGYRNTKEIIVEGDSGFFTGWEMLSGSITINASAGNAIANEMKGGTITVLQNAGADAGCGMQGGKLIVCGNVRSSCGMNMLKGEIEVWGNAEFGLGAELKGGSILVKGSCGD